MNQSDIGKKKIFLFVKNPNRITTGDCSKTPGSFRDSTNGFLKSYFKAGYLLFHEVIMIKQHDYLCGRVVLYPL